MIYLLLNVNDKAHHAFAEAVEAAGIPLDGTINVYADDPGCINRWGIGVLSCVVGLNAEGTAAIHQVSTVEGLATFQADYAAALAAQG